MRWKGLIFILAVAAIFLLLGWLLSDSWLEKRIENAGSSVVGAKVEIDNLDASILRGYLRWDSLQVTDPDDTWKNLLATGRAELDFEVLPLLRKKVVVEDIALENVNSGSERTTDGKIEKKQTVQSSQPNIFQKSAKKLQDRVKQTPAWDFAAAAKELDVDTLLAVLELESPAKIDSLQEYVTRKSSYWDSVYSAADWSSRLNNLEAEIRTLETADPKTVQGLTSALAKINKIRKEADSLKTVLAAAKNNMTHDFETIFSQTKMVDEWIEEDYRQALSLAKLPTISTQTIGQFLFGEKIVANVTKVFNILGKVRYYSSKLPQSKPKKEKPPRLKGQNIRFPGQLEKPDFWIKRIDLSGFTQKGITVSGKILNIADFQKLTGAPTEFEINGSRPDGAAIAVEGEFNYLSNAPKELLQVSVKSIPLSNVQLSNSALLPNKIAEGRGSLQAGLVTVGDSLDLGISFRANNLVFAFAETAEGSNFVTANLQEIIKQTSSVSIQGKIFAVNEDTRFTVSSNLDDLFAERLKGLMSDQIVQGRQKIREEIDKQLAPRKEKLVRFTEAKREEAQKKFGDIESRIDSSVQLVENKKKELEKRLEEEKKKAANEVGNRLKGLFN